MYFEVYKDAKGEHRWALVANNGRVIADSAEGYKRRRDALDSIDLVRMYAKITATKFRRKPRDPLAAIAGRPELTNLPGKK